MLEALSEGTGLSPGGIGGYIPPLFVVGGCSIGSSPTFKGDLVLLEFSEDCEVNFCDANLF